MTLHICYHDRCFDGAASAALFRRFYRDRISSTEEVRFFGLTHRAGGGMDRSLLAVENSVIVDFGFENTPNLTWWFDHHISAFLSDEDRAAFEADTSGQKFFDPKAPSCTGFLARTLVEKFGYDVPSFAETVYWADIIDAARFPDAETAVALEKPALQLASLIESSKDDAFIPRIIEDLSTKTLSEVVALEYVQEKLQPMLKSYRENLAACEDAAKLVGDIVCVDLFSQAGRTMNKFFAYRMFPTARYSLALTREPARLKVSVGSNPWPVAPRTHNIAEICKKHGGGGHPVVGAVTIPVGEDERARRVYEEILAELRVG